ncbi:MAG TPA: TIGR03885 family FMN-dependent LLM class oxidoreductase [Actinomycetota bacterium]|nr:TIGR03885 family FMN-dependent LLM class oxidoreductase [Actinomycetota bacterium]
MPLQNRVTPFGAVIADPARGLVHGNRGCLHDEDRRIRRHHAGKRWIACRLEFKGWRRSTLMQPGRYTELFFVDDATALAAGHRACALCRRADYDRLAEIWRGLHPADRGADAIDARLHAERWDGTARAQRRHDGRIEALPDGAFVLRDGEPYVVLGREIRRWTPSGYGGPVARGVGGIEVITPRTSSRCSATDGNRSSRSSIPRRRPEHDPSRGVEPPSDGYGNTVPTVGFHVSHEQLSPARALEAVRAAEAAGFRAAMCSDHLAPWGERQGESGFAWSWLGAAMQATSLPFGVVTAPGQRYHPSIIAQAIATLGDLFPGRFWAALGSGEAVNEHVTGDRWPDKPTRDARLLECVEVIRALLGGEEVSHEGLVRVDRARVWSLPEGLPPLYGAAVSEETARTVGGWADGMITVYRPVDELARVIDAFREGGGDRKPVAVQVHLSWAGDEEEALAVAHDQWRTNVFGSDVAWNLELPSQFDAAARSVRPEDVTGSVLVSSDPSQHTKWLLEIADLDVDAIYLHHVGKEQDRFLEVFGRDVLPEVNP